MTGWALEDAPNPTLLRLHVDVALTSETILTCPPASAPQPLDRLLEIEAIRSFDLHRYRARLNLRADADRAGARAHAAEVLASVWGAARRLPPDPGPRAFQATVAGPRVVAESPAMASGHPVLEPLFALEGVSEAIAGDGLVLVRLGRLFEWDGVEAAVAAAIQSSVASGAGIPGSTSAPR